MIIESRNLEVSLGNGIKTIENNEKKTVIIQRRSVCANKNLKVDEIINKKNIICLRPSPNKSVKPYEISKILGKKLKVNKSKGESIYWKDIK